MHDSLHSHDSPHKPETAANGFGVQGNRKTGRRTIWIIAGAVSAVLLIVLIVCLAVLLPRRNSNSKNNNNNGDISTGAGFYTYAADAYPSPIAISGTTPQNENAKTLDPSLIRRASDGKYFLFTTSKANGSLWTADALSGPWNKTRGPGSGNGGLLDEECGAPQVYGPMGDEGLYYLYHNSHRYNYAEEEGVTDPQAKKPSHDASLVVHSSKTLEPDSWDRLGRLAIPWASKYNVLDAALLTISANDTSSANDTNILAFGSYQTGLYAVPLQDPPTALASNAMDQLAHLEANSSATHPQGQTEAAYLYNRGAWTYLFFSSGRCCPEEGGTWPTTSAGEVYRVMVCRKSANGVGDMTSWDNVAFVDKEGKSCREADGGTEILASHGGIWAPGGQGVLEDDSDEAGDEGVLLYYHYVPFDESAGKPGTGFRFGFNRLSFDDDAWPVVV